MPRWRYHLHPGLTKGARWRLLSAPHYTTAIDVWSVGCIFAELVSGEPLFAAQSEIELLNKMFRLLGAPNEKVWPGFSKLWPGYSASAALGVGVTSQQFNNLRQVRGRDSERHSVARSSDKRSLRSSPSPRCRRTEGWGSCGGAEVQRAERARAGADEGAGPPRHMDWPPTRWP